MSTDDITERNKPEHEAKLHAEILRNMSEGVVLTRTSDRKIIYCSQRFNDMFGYAPGELTGCDVSILNAPTQVSPQAAARSIQGHLSKGGLWRGEVANIKKDGTVFCCEVNLSTFNHPEFGEVWVACHKDITGYRQVVAELQEAKEAAEKYLNISAELILRLDSQGSIELLNESGHRLLGYSPGELNGKNWFDTCVPPEARNDVRAVFQKLMEGNFTNVKVYENAVVTKNGKVRLLLWHNSLLKDENARIIGTLSSAQDITGRKMAEDALEKQKYFLEKAQDIGLIGTWELDLVNDVLSWTEQNYRNFGVPAGTPMNYASFLQCVHPDDREFLDTEWTAAVNGKPYDIEHRVVSDGMVKWVREKAELEVDKNGNVISAIGTTQDITERKLFEQKIRLSEVRYKALFEATTDYVLVLELLHDESPVIVEANAAAFDMTGYSRDEMIGKPVSFLDVELTEEILAARLKMAWSGKRAHFETKRLRKDGSTFWVDIIGKKLTIGDKDYFYTVERDINERKQTEKELEDHRYHLEELVELRTRQLTEARQQAEAANIAKSAFLANMSHEIRTPMNAIIGLTHLMQNAETLPGQAEQLTKINNAAEHLLAVINDVLDVSKIEAERLVLEQIDFSLDAVLENVKSLLSDQVKSSGLSMLADTDQVPLWLHGDATRLRQCLLNYAGNAIKFTQHGTITLRVRQLQENADGILLRFEVQDTGIGIAADKLTSLFHAFQQADASTTRKYGGSGLGLVITQRLAHLMGGEVGVESELGKGSTFWFTARFGHGKGIQQEAPGAAVEQPVRDYSVMRVLLVEDNEINCEVAAALLKQIGVNADMAPDGREAINMVSANAYDLILMDVQMPNIDGLEATRMIRCMEGCMPGSKVRYHDVPILAMTANVYEEDRRICLEAGMDDFIAKPVNPNDLFEMIGKWSPAA